MPIFHPAREEMEVVTLFIFFSNEFLLGGLRWGFLEVEGWRWEVGSGSLGWDWEGGWEGGKGGLVRK